MKTKQQTHINLNTEELMAKILKEKEGKLSHTNAIVSTTGKYTGRSPMDKFIVLDKYTKEEIFWGNTNQSIEEEVFEKLYKKVMNHLKSKETYLFKGFAGADKKHQISIEVITEYAWHHLFAKHMFIEPNEKELEDHVTEFKVISAPTFKANLKKDGTNSEVFIIINLTKKIVLIGGTEYAGEIKKSVFSIMNYLLPKKNILPMHCSANVGKKNDVTLFFGLSGTGKTTLSADKNRLLIGDDEHGWSDTNVFNFEGGCYAKTIQLREDKEPEIFNAIKNGAILENVIVDENGVPDYNNDSLTENTRAAYPLNHLKNVVSPSVSGVPKTIIFLTADAYGVLPPISKLNEEQAMYYFLNGYTSKLAGTERGVTEPKTVFSACFGEPFLPLDPKTYANLLKEKISKHNVKVFLVNTGWTGGSYGNGERMKLSYTREMVKAAIEGHLNEIDYVKHSIFEVMIPKLCPNVPSDLLIPEKTWKNKNEYIKKATELKEKFKENYKRFE